MKKITLVDEWRKWYKMFSQWCNTAGMGGIAAYALLPDQLKDALSPTMALWIAGGLFALGFIGRLVKQKKVSDDT